MKVMTISIGQFGTGDIADSVLNILNRVGSSIRACIPLDRVAIEATAVIGSVSPRNIDGVIT